MTQRTAAHISIWIMILLGFFLAFNIFVVPYFANMLAQMDIQLPLIAQCVLNLSDFMTHFGWFFVPLYAILFITVIVWHSKAKTSAIST